MTYYGRWTYKYEIAAEKNAAGAIIIHHTEDAGYGWAVVENSWTGEQFSIEREDLAADRCAVESWVTGEVAEAIFAMAGRSLEEARAAAVSRDFRPFSLGLHASVRVENDLRTLKSNNFIARLDGNDPAVGNECIVYNAHWDHLGIGKPVDGDAIYNGALDNASGVAGMMEVARLFGEHRGELQRSVLFLICTAEESGLLGAYYYVDHPSVPLTKTVAMINVDGLNVWGAHPRHGGGRARAIRPRRHPRRGAGGRRTQCLPGQRTGKGLLLTGATTLPLPRRACPRSIPTAVWTSSASRMAGAWRGAKSTTASTTTPPTTSTTPAWDFSGAAQDMMALFRVGLKLAASDRWPEWSQTSEFRAVREEALQGAR